MNTIATAAARLTSAEEIQARVNELVAIGNWDTNIDYQSIKELYTNP